MAKIEYRKAALSKDSLEMLHTINEIIEEYVEMVYRLTLRQLYYQLVSRDVIPNNDKEYKKIGHLLKEGRMAGIVDWDAIEDRMRKPERPYWVLGLDDAVKDTIEQYRLDRQQGQPYKLLVIVEKDALSGVLAPITGEYMIPILVNRGYGSCTVMHDLHKMFSRDERPGKILYIGDHDPSGLDMIRDVTDRIEEFGTFVDVEPIALTYDQVETYGPPPNPAKFKDPRASGYVELYGATSWEVDALRPPVLVSVLEEAIEQNMDMDLFTEMKEKEEEDKRKLAEFLNT